MCQPGYYCPTQAVSQRIPCPPNTYGDAYQLTTSTFSGSCPGATDCNPSWGYSRSGSCPSLAFRLKLPNASYVRLWPTVEKYLIMGVL